jgi:spermidine synthase
MLGGGGYSIPKWLLAGRSDLARNDFFLDVVELDPGMTRAAGKYFQVPLHDPRMRVYHEDARAFINRASAAVPAGEYGPYDLIFADIFNSWYTVPFHVGTREVARKIHGLLAKEGIYMMNIITAVNGDNGRLLRSIRNAFREVFGSVELFTVHSRDAAMVQNVMLLAFRTPRPLPDPLQEKMPRHMAKILATRWTASFPAQENDVPPLSDAFAPVERYTLGF